MLEHLLRLLPETQDYLIQQLTAVENQAEENPVQSSRDCQGVIVT